MPPTITVTSNSALVAVRLAKIIPALKIEIETGINEAMQCVNDGTKTHRFKNHSHMLEKSVRNKTLSFNSGTVYVDLGVAKYGEWIHNGSKRHFVKPKNAKILSWDGYTKASKGHWVSGIKAEPFLYLSARRNRKKVIEILSMSTKKALETLSNGTK
jgi:hypothetical protein